MTRPPAVLFVCLGNICRSPLAEGALRLEAERLDFSIEIDSAGTGDYHIGAPPDRRAQAVALRHGADISRLAARQVSEADFRRFDHVIALDHENLQVLRRIRPNDATARLSLLLDHVEGRAGEPVADPYYGHADGFETTWKDVTAGAKALLAQLIEDREREKAD